jgi:hypothetical protein
MTFSDFIFLAYYWMIAQQLLTRTNLEIPTMIATPIMAA